MKKPTNYTAIRAELAESRAAAERIYAGRRAALVADIGHLDEAFWLAAEQIAILPVEDQAGGWERVIGWLLPPPPSDAEATRH